MDTKTLIAVLVPSVLSLILAIVSLVLSYLKDRNHKREMVWTAAVQQLIASTKWDDYNPYTTTASINQALHMQFLYRALGYIAAGDEQSLKKLCRELPEMWPTEEYEDEPVDLSEPDA